MTSELADTLHGLRWQLPRTDDDARAALGQLAQVSARLTGLAAQHQGAAPSWLGPVQALIAQGGFTLDWWQPLLAEPDLDWTINHQAHLAADLAQIAAAGARILDQLTPSSSAPPPPTVVKSVASFGSVPMGSAATIPPVVPTAPPTPPRSKPTGTPLLSSSVPGLKPPTKKALANQQAMNQRLANQQLANQPSSSQPPSHQQVANQQLSNQPPAPPRMPNQGPVNRPSVFQGLLDDSDPLSDSGRHRRGVYEAGPSRSTWRDPAEDRFPSHVQPYADEDDYDDPMLSPGRRLPQHTGMIVQATVVLCVVGALSWWAVTALHGSPSRATAATTPPAGAQTGASTQTLAAGLNPPSASTPAQSAPTANSSAPPAKAGAVTVSDLDVSLLGGSDAQRQIDVFLTFNASSTASVTITINYYGTSGGGKIAPETASWTESGHTGYQLAETIPSSAYCGSTVTVVATSGSASSQASTQPGC